MGILFLAASAGWLLSHARRGFPRAAVVGGVLFWLALVQFWILGCGVTTRLIGVPLEGEEQGVDAVRRRMSGCDVQAIVLLGGGVGVHEECGRAEMFSGADRCWMVAQLWTDKMPLTVSGGGAAGERIVLKALGVAEECIIAVDEARNTEEEARLIRERLAALGKKDGRPAIALVTSAWHMPRAKSLFERAGFEVLEAPCDYEMHMVAERPIEVQDFLPNADSLLRNSYAAKEWVARFCYWLKGCCGGTSSGSGV